MRIALIGAGGIGLFYVCRLMQAGHDVLAVARGAQLEAMRAHGLRVEHPEHPYEGPVPVCSLPELLDRDPGSIDLVVLLTKSIATAELAGQLGPWIGDASTSVLSLQNGVALVHNFDRGRELAWPRLPSSSDYLAIRHPERRHGIQNLAPDPCLDSLCRQPSRSHR